jgi:hypothetical protein|tara:strand:+ start:128 stop:346 length:219 start_codon:yes stop_codon:yes gene_type:complete
MANLNAHIPIVVVHKGPRKNSKIELEIFNNTRVDDVIDGNKRKPLIPHHHEILDIGVGSSFEEKYKKKYKLN